MLPPWWRTNHRKNITTRQNDSERDLEEYQFGNEPLRSCARGHQDERGGRFFAKRADATVVVSNDEEHAPVAPRSIKPRKRHASKELPPLVSQRRVQFPGEHSRLVGIRS
jgi:hypothetical protein